MNKYLLYIIGALFAVSLLVLNRMLVNVNLEDGENLNLLGWWLWAIGFSRKLVEAGLVLWFAFLFWRFLDNRITKTLAEQGIQYGFRDFILVIKDHPQAASVYYSTRFASVIIAMAIVWSR